MHQESHQVSSSYSEEVLEWQKLARKEKSSSVYQEHRLSSVSHDFTVMDSFWFNLTNLLIQLQSNFVAPLFTSPLEPLVVEEDDQAKLIVAFEANPRPVIKWLRYTFQLKTNEDIHIDEQDNSSTLTIKKACLDDTGIFTCLLENPAGSTKSSTNLTVLEKNPQINEQQMMESTTTYTSSSFMEQKKSSSTMIQESSRKQSSQIIEEQSSKTQVGNKTMHVKKNDKIRIDIQFKDGSKSDLTFTHNGTPLTESNQEGIEITFSNDIATLTIDNSQPKHSGTYQCIMKTEGGEARCSVNCQVE